MKKRILQWDPSWGWNNEIYHLGSKSNDKTSFWLKKNHLYANGEIQFSSPEYSILNAGSFTKNFYIGSLSRHYFFKDKENHMPKGFEDIHIDQSLFACDREWNIVSKFELSSTTNKTSKFFSVKKYKNKLFVPFRDPSPINSSKIFGVCTGGFRWGLKGNVCEVKFENNRFEITKETILDENMDIFPEIERCTFWNEFMFFSAGSGECFDEKWNKIFVAKLSENGLYKYYGEVKNSRNIYGPDVNASLQMLFWYKNDFKINNPGTQNLFFENGHWIIKEKLINKVNVSLRENQRRFSLKNIKRKINELKF